MTNNRGELREELRELSLDLSADGIGAVLLFGGGNPAGHDVVSINLESKAMEEGAEQKKQVVLKT